MTDTYEHVFIPEKRGSLHIIYVGFIYNVTSFDESEELMNVVMF